MKRRGLPPSPSLGRPVQQIQPKVELVIACEGTVTEPDYLEKCVDYYGAGLVKVRIVEPAGVPLTVVKVAVSERERLVRQYRREAGLGPRCPFSVWAIFDKDEHEVDAALALADEKKIGVAFSNPCFELWPLLHLVDYGAQDGRHAVQRALHEKMPRYHHATAPRVDFEEIKDLFETAYARATLLNTARKAEGCDRGCPSTDVGELIKKIQQNGRVKVRRDVARNPF